MLRFCWHVCDFTASQWVYALFLMCLMASQGKVFPKSLRLHIPRDNSKPRRTQRELSCSFLLVSWWSRPFSCHGAGVWAATFTPRCTPSITVTANVILESKVDYLWTGVLDATLAALFPGQEKNLPNTFWRRARETYQVKGFHPSLCLHAREIVGKKSILLFLFLFTCSWTYSD